MSVPAVLARLAEEAGTPLVGELDGSGLRFGDSEVRHVASWEANRRTVVVQEYHRGAPPRVVLRTEDLGVVWRFLALVTASAWRSRHGLGMLVAEEDSLPSGYEVVKEALRRAALRWPSGLAEGMREFQALRLAHACAHSLDEVVEAIREPEGRPVFADPTPR